MTIPRRGLHGRPARPRRTPRYLCLNIVGMGEARAAMRLAGMLAMEGSPIRLPSCRSLPAEALDGTPFHPESYYPDELCTPEQVAYMDALDHWRRYRPTGNVGIQAWKLESNDHWIVTAEECAEALRAWESLSPGRQQEIREAVVEMDIGASDASIRSAAIPDVTEDLDDASSAGDHVSAVVHVKVPRTALARFIAEWDEWLGFLRLGAEGDGFMVD